jgi:SSS family solute:Na+ symporter
MNDYINMWWGITCSIFGGAGPVLVGGLYWKKGTSAGAISAFITGSVLSLGAILIRMVYHSHGEAFVQNHTHFGFIDLGYFAALKDGHYEFFMNGTFLGFYAGMIALATYVIVSLLTCKEDFNLERMLHRGPYAAVKKLVGDAPLPKRKESIIMGKLIGIDENFTRSDKWIAVALFSWTMFMFSVFLVISGWNLIAPWNTASWSTYWHITAYSLPIFFAVVTGVWFTWGGIKDIRLLFQRLRDQKVNALDDGTVVDNQNLDELAAEKKLDPADLHS